MRRLTVLAAAVAVLAACAALAFAVAAEDNPPGSPVSDTEVYSISYRLNGGTLADDAPSSYVAGSYMILPIPVRDGYWFAGWSLGSSLNNPLGGILPDTRGHLVLYAEWIDDPRSGVGWAMNVSGTYTSGGLEHTVDGRVTFAYEGVYDGEAYFRTTNDLTYSWDGGSTTDETTTYRWVERITDGWTYTGNVTVDGERLTVWTDGEATVWLRDMLYIVRMTEPIVNGIMTYVMESVYEYTPSKSFDANVTAEYPVSVTGGVTVSVGGDLTLTASGETFAGWYLNGELVSTDPTYTFHRPTASDAIVAKTSSDYEALASGGDVLALGFQASSVRDASGNAVRDVHNLGTGYYTAEDSSGDVRRTLRFVVDEQREFTVTWTYNGKSYTITLDLLYSEAYRYEYENPILPRYSQNSQSHVEAFHTFSDPTVVRLADELRSLGSGMSDRRFAEFVLKFVQTVPYIEDGESRGTDEYWKFPIETLWDGGGDCEDTSFLYDTLMGICGYRTAFVLFMDHAMSSVLLDIPGECVTVDGYGYVLCETTTTDFAIGRTSAGHHPADAIFSCRIETMPAA